MFTGAQQVFPESAGVNDKGHLVIGGCDTLDLADQYGTPLYVFDEDMVRSMCRGFVEGFTAKHADTTVVYACKAYVNPALARHPDGRRAGVGRGLRRRIGRSPGGGLPFAARVFPRQ